jgi:hypothetical protein
MMVLLFVFLGFLYFEICLGLEICFLGFIIWFLEFEIWVLFFGS